MMLVKFTECVVIFLVFLLYFVTPEETLIYEYGSNNFKQQIAEMDGNFIMFYAPWCRHCTDFHPIWHELAELINSKDSKFAIAQVDCTVHSELCNENHITGYPSLLYFHKNSFVPLEYKGTRDLHSLTFFLNEIFSKKAERELQKSSQVTIYSGMAYLNDLNIEKFLSKGQHFVMFFVPWCQASQKLAPIWAELGVEYANNDYIQIGKVNCQENEMTCNNFDIKQYPYLLWIVNGRIMGIADADTLEYLKNYVQKMLLAENHDPEKFMKKKKSLPVARITEETFETFLEKDIVFINYFAPWCAYCMQLNPLWVKLGERYQNETRVIIADVDCVRSKPVCEAEKIISLPTLILYKNKKIISSELGGQKLESLVSLVREQLDAIEAPEDTPEPHDSPPKDEL